VDKRWFHIMIPLKFFYLKLPKELKFDIYIREVIDLGEKVLQKALDKSKWIQRFRLYHNRKRPGIMIPLTLIFD
jgi:predicted naringenin-chalcone synthase